MGDKEGISRYSSQNDYLIGEPILRKDGKIVCVERSIEDSLLIFSCAGKGTYYPKNEVAELGEGNLEVGIARLGRAYYELPLDALPNKDPQTLFEQVQQLDDVKLNGERFK